MGLLWAVIAVVLGLVGLVVGADRFVVGAASFARNLGVSPLIVGMVIVGLGTSAPEMLVSVVAALDGQGGIAVGNALGSNAANIGLVLGTAALIRPVPLGSHIARSEMPVLVGVTAIACLVLMDGTLDRLDGVVLLAALALVIGRMVWSGRRSKPLVAAGAVSAATVGSASRDDGGSGDAEAPLMSNPVAFMWLMLGLGILVGASRATVWGATLLAQAFGVSDLVIGLTVVALGTSLPELAATIVSAAKGEHELAVGNVIGSNTFNLLAVLPLPGLLSPGDLAGEVVVRDLPVVAGLTLLCWALTFGWGRPASIGRAGGFALLAIYVAYMVYVALGSASVPGA